MEDMYFGKTYDEIFDKNWKAFCRGREEHEFTHYNSSLGMQIYGKEHLKSEMKKRRMLPYDTCEDLAQEWDKQNSNKKLNSLSPKADAIIRQLKLMADGNGNIKLGGRAIKALKEIGAISDTQHRPEELVGGFS